MYRRDTYNKKSEEKVMKKIFKILCTVALSLALCIPSMAAMAAVSPEEQPSPEEQLGYLISSKTYDNGDGTYSVEKIYTKHSPAFYSTELYGTDEFTKVKEDKLNTGSLLVSYQITATFDWDTRTNEKTGVSGNNTSKATAKYSFTRTTNLGFSKNYSVSVSCNYKGTDS